MSVFIRKYTIDFKRKFKCVFGDFSTCVFECLYMHVSTSLFGRARACSKPCLCTRSCECSCVCARACVCNVCICLSLRVSLCVLVFHTWFQCHISIPNSPVRLTHICKQNYTRVSDWHAIDVWKFTTGP